MKGTQANRGGESGERHTTYVGSVASVLRSSGGNAESEAGDGNANAVDAVGTVRAAGPDAEPESVPLDTLFSILSNERRRLALHTLRHESEPMDRRDLAETVAALENGKERADVTPTERKRVYVSLHQHHLPKLEDAGAVVCDASKVSVGTNADAIVSYLPGVRTSEPTTSAPATAESADSGCASTVGLVGAGLFAAGALGAGTLGVGAQLAAAGAVVTALGTALALSGR
jgi:hypothetical protein